MTPKFPLGQVVATAAIAAQMAEYPHFHTGKHILIDAEVRETCNGYKFGEILHVPQMFLFTMGTGHTNHQADCTKLPRSTEYGDSP